MGLWTCPTWFAGSQAKWASLAGLVVLGITAWGAWSDGVAIIDGPCEIEWPGRYRLAADLESADPEACVIRIKADDVDLDLDGHEIRCTNDALTRRAMAIWAEDCERVRIRHGTIRGFSTGVLIWDHLDENRRIPTGGHEVVGLHIVGSTFCGVRVRGSKSTIRDCRIESTGGTRAYEEARVFGIDAAGAGFRIEGNFVNGLEAQGGGEAVGVSIAEDGAHSRIERNCIVNAARIDQLSIGIWVGGASDTGVEGNMVACMRWGAAVASVSSAQLDGNTFSGCELAIHHSDTARGEGRIRITNNLVHDLKDELARQPE
jgi:nitrous oxidase accessory protein NosD